jgi:hypothetical protein
MCLQQKMSMYIKWFQWILSEFIDRSEQDLARIQWTQWILSEFIDGSEHDLASIQWTHWSSEWGLMNCIHII